MTAPGEIPTNLGDPVPVRSGESDNGYYAAAEIVTSLSDEYGDFDDVTTEQIAAAPLARLAPADGRVESHAYAVVMHRATTGPTGEEDPDQYSTAVAVASPPQSQPLTARGRGSRVETSEPPLATPDELLDPTLHPAETQGLQLAARALSSASAPVDRTVNLAVVRGIHVARQRADEYEREPSETDAHPAQLPAVAGQTAAIPARRPAEDVQQFSFVELQGAAEEHLSGHRGIEGEGQDNTISAALLPRTGRTEANKVLHPGKSPAKQSRYDAMFHSEPPPFTETQARWIYDDALHKEAAQADPEKRTASPHASAMVKVLGKEREYRQHHLGWERHQHPELPLTLRPDDVNEWEARDVAGRVIARDGYTDPLLLAAIDDPDQDFRDVLQTRQGYTPTNIRAAIDDLEQGRADEQYLWGRQFDPPQNGILLPPVPRPHPLTDAQRESMRAQVSRTGVPAYVADAAVDERIQAIDAGTYAWDLALLRLQGDPRAERYPTLARPALLTEAQIRTLTDEAYHKLGDMLAARNEVDFAVNNRRQERYWWDRDFHALYTGQRLENATPMFSDDDFMALDPPGQRQFLLERAQELAANDARDGGPLMTQEWLDKKARFDRLRRLSMRVDLDATGHARQLTADARMRAAQDIPGYNPDPALRTAIIYYGGVVDMTLAVAAALGGYRQIFTVGNHNDPRVGERLAGALTRLLEANPGNDRVRRAVGSVVLNSASPFLTRGITGDLVVIAPGSASQTNPDDIPGVVRPGGSLIVAGSPYAHDREFLIKLAQRMAAPQHDGEATFDTVDPLPGGTVTMIDNDTPQVHPDADPTAVGAIFHAARD